MALETNNDQIHFVLFPFMAQGHMIPMMDIAKLVAQREVLVTIVTTHENAARFEASIDRAVRLGLRIQILKLTFPCEQVGLPKGCENFDMLPHRGMISSLFVGAALLQAPAEKALEDMNPRSSCIISDTSLPWTMYIANKLCIPRITFTGSSSIHLACMAKILRSNIVKTLDSDTQAFVVPGLPHRIEFTKDQMSIPIVNEEMEMFFKGVGDAEKASFGTILNSFEELELGYAKVYMETIGRKVWCAGPVSLCNENEIEKTRRDDNDDLDRLSHHYRHLRHACSPNLDEHTCLKWLDLWPKSCVVYVCMGFLCTLTPSQLVELESGLEASKKPFVWIIRAGEKKEEVEKLFKEDGFEERIKGRGIMIWGWAPQLLILSHPAVGGFLTHCGWNSILEGVCAGLPLITWPLVNDQFANKKLVDQVLKIGVGVEPSAKQGGKKKIGALVNREDIERAIRTVMDEGEEGENRRKKARELGKMAKRAPYEGGSSYNNLSMLIQDVMNQKIALRK